MLQLNHVRKEYIDGSQMTTAVAVDDLTIKAGEQVALVGPSGSGKTTLLHLISGILMPTAGEITFDDIEVSGRPETWRDIWRANTVGYVFQKLNLLASMNVMDNLLVAMSFADAIPVNKQRQWAGQLLEQVNLADKYGKFPHQLSMGEQQRIAVIRAIVNKPRLILADEPTASLDQDNGLQVIELLLQLAKEFNSILLVSTHDRQIMSQFTRIYPLRQAAKAVNENAVYDSLA